MKRFLIIYLLWLVPLYADLITLGKGDEQVIVDSNRIISVASVSKTLCFDPYLKKWYPINGVLGWGFEKHLLNTTKYRPCTEKDPAVIVTLLVSSLKMSIAQTSGIAVDAKIESPPHIIEITIWCNIEDVVNKIKQLKKAVK